MKVLRNRTGPASRRRFTDRPTGRLFPQCPSHASVRKTSDFAILCARSSRVAELEALLFQAKEPISVEKLAEWLHQTTDIVIQTVDQLATLYQQDESAFTLDALAGGYILRTRPDTTPWLVRLKRIPAYHALPANLLETLSVIAHRQPVTRADVEAVRGVACSEPMKVLLGMGLIRTAGRHASLGRPQLYATTRRFLQTFGLNSLAELPTTE